jgi:hypothetical protein
MSTIQTFTLIAALLTGGCAVVQPEVLEQPIGPQPIPPEAQTDHGSLVVYSNIVREYGDPDYLVRTGYSVLTAKGELVQKIDNRSGASDERPLPLNLPIGQDTVVAEAANDRRVTLSAVIRAGRTTVIDLDQEVFPRGTDARGNWVHLSTGQIVGPKAD